MKNDRSITSLLQHGWAYQVSGKTIVDDNSWWWFLGEEPPVIGSHPIEERWEWDDLSPEQKQYFWHCHAYNFDFMQRSRGSEFACEWTMATCCASLGIECPHISERRIYRVRDEGQTSECLDCHAWLQHAQMSERDRWEKEQRQQGWFIPRRDLTCPVQMKIGRQIDFLEVPPSLLTCGLPLSFYQAHGPANSPMIDFIEDMTTAPVPRAAHDRRAEYRCPRGHVQYEPVSALYSIPEKYQGVQNATIHDHADRCVGARAI